MRRARLLLLQSRIAKRDRKLVDYDSARHNHSSTNKGKKGKDGGIKITKVTGPLLLSQHWICSPFNPA
jgi:hypothetical protein